MPNLRIHRYGAAALVALALACAPPPPEEAEPPGPPLDQHGVGQWSKALVRLTLDFADGADGVIRVDPEEVRIQSVKPDRPPPAKFQVVWVVTNPADLPQGQTLVFREVPPEKRAQNPEKEPCQGDLLQPIYAEWSVPPSEALVSSSAQYDPKAGEGQCWAYEVFAVDAACADPDNAECVRAHADPLVYIEH